VTKDRRNEKKRYLEKELIDAGVRFYKTANTTNLKLPIRQ
jgi:hypothetical protein